MSRDADDTTLDDVESGERDPLTRGALNGSRTHPNANNSSNNDTGAPRATKSMYALTRAEITRGMASRLLHSQAYIGLYLAMAALSATTVVLSLKDGCPGTSFYILEIIVNAAMILEVVLRFLASGSAFWRFPFNVFDLVVTFFSVITLFVIFFVGCSAGSKEEEILDTLLLITRNVIQFGRLATVVRQSGQSIFSRPKPIDLHAAARRSGFHDMSFPGDDADDDDGYLNRYARPTPGTVLFDARAHAQADREREQAAAAAARARTRAGWESEMPRAAQAARERDVEDTWAELG